MWASKTRPKSVTLRRSLTAARTSARSCPSAIRSIRVLRAEGISAIRPFQDDEPPRRCVDTPRSCDASCRELPSARSLSECERMMPRRIGSRLQAWNHILRAIERSCLHLTSLELSRGRSILAFRGIQLVHQRIIAHEHMTTKGSQPWVSARVSGRTEERLRRRGRDPRPVRRRRRARSGRRTRGRRRPRTTAPNRARSRAAPRT